jgi:hypothetical protein
MELGRSMMSAGAGAARATGSSTTDRKICSTDSGVLEAPHASVDRGLRGLLAVLDRAADLEGHLGLNARALDQLGQASDGKGCAPSTCPRLRATTINGISFITACDAHPLDVPCHGHEAQ